MKFRLIRNGKRLKFIICHVAKPGNGANMRDAGLKYDVILSFNPQFIMNSCHFSASENIVIVMAMFLKRIVLRYIDMIFSPPSCRMVDLLCHN